MIKRIALMGAGSLGTIFGALLTQKGHDIVLVDTNAEHVNALNTTGAHIVGSIDEVIPVKACLPDQMEGTYDLFIYMAKQTFNDKAIPQMMAHCHENTIIATCQNGLPEVALNKYYPAEKIMGVPINWAAIFQGPGTSYLATPRDLMNVTLGTYTGEHTPELDEVAAILGSVVQVSMSANLMGLRWSKLIINASYSGLSTVNGISLGAVSQDKDLMKIVCYINRECIRVMQAADIQRELIHAGGKSYDFEAMFSFDNEPDVDAAFAAAGEYMRGTEKAMASMLQDIQKGIPCEIDAINGAVCDAGKEYGVPTPVNNQIVDIVRKIERGVLSPDRKTADLIVCK